MGRPAQGGQHAPGYNRSHSEDTTLVPSTARGFARPGPLWAGGRSICSGNDGADRHGTPVTYYIIIRGPLGIGKSTIATSLAKETGAALISIDRILDEHGLWESGRPSEFLMANAYAAEEARELLAKEIPVIFDGNFYWKSQLADLLERLDFSHHVFTLTAPLGVCVERDDRRHPSYGRKAVEEVYAKSTKFTYGIELDATHPIGYLIGEITSRLSRS